MVRILTNSIVVHEHWPLASTRTGSTFSAIGEKSGWQEVEDTEEACDSSYLPTKVKIIHYFNNWYAI